MFLTLSSNIGAPSDHAAFEQGGQPTLFLSCAHGRFYHDEKDDLNWINFKKLARITKFTATCIRKIDETPGGETTDVPDTVHFFRTSSLYGLSAGHISRTPSNPAGPTTR
ncbi:M28 family peptidase [bacterium]|nr:M28 family peptidase [bacterium]MDB4657234.1 M28 family peptidase [Verrucomicrobiales bacterium]